ncbi:non-ribosomal peptide synthetase [Nonomuraea sp. NBC_01738]|uniref:non-ribosomal peptide synthetase n=1 Tax=Nonomuraea sp. NBC_01738 TaxID=2976003 RepID=UPI002E0F3130|nr:non-ribosomal peptide synthetase [Nonomuraea sp. NBC_01738]
MTLNDTYSRTISRVERWFLAYPDWVPAVIQVFVEGAGSLDERALSAAVERASAACPGSRLVRRGPRWADSRVAPAVRTVDGATVDRRTFAGVADLHRPLTGDGEPTCEVLLLTGDEPAVVFRAFHGVMDGKGVLTWAEDVFRCLRGEQPQGAPSRLNETEFAERFGVEAVNADMAQQWPSVLGPRGEGGERGFFWRRLSVDGVHPAMVARLAAVLAGGRDGRFMVPVDLRRHDPSIVSTANLIQTLPLDVPAGDSWEDAHQRLLTMLAERRDLATQVDGAIMTVPLPALRTQVMAIDAMAAASDRYAAGATVSHVGRLDLAAFSGPGFTATTVYALPNPGPAGPPEFNITEVRGRTELTVGWFDEPHLVARAEELLAEIAGTLSPPALRSWAGNATDRPFREDVTVVHRLRERVLSCPEAVALTGPEGDVTYAGLGAKIDAVAAGLRRRGVAPGSVVGLLAGRTVAAMAALWGIMQAGAAYLPLDGQHPDARLADVVADSGAPLCLVERAYADRACVPAGCERVILDELLEEPGETGPIDAVPDGLAYVIYTSGSTGRPKGVEVEHRNLAAFAGWAERVYDLDARSRFPLFTSLAFDLSNTAIFVPLLVGGSVVLVPQEPDHLVLRDVLRNSGATVLKVTPTHLDLIGRLGIEPEGFRTVIAGGELLRVAVAAEAQRMFGAGCRIFNEYGPTETTIGCTARLFDGDTGSGSVPIGLPGDNTKIFLLDPEGRFVAPGMPGEMHIAGAQVARGYRGRPELTVERFTRMADGRRVYRTGDMARLLPSGELESLGRNDEQLKIHGYRIEPGEIARVLEEHPAVTRAVVAARTRPGGVDRHLQGFVIADAADERELTSFLAARLPAYMVPSAIVRVAELPLTANGKVDLDALPDPYGEAVAGRVEPGDETEEAVRKIWARVLGVEAARIGTEADFHRLGGDSVGLLAMVAAVCEEVLAGERERDFMATGLRRIIGNPTLATVCALLRELESPRGERR